VQPLNWYVHRLRTMSPAEIAWRGRLELRDAVDRVRIPLGIVPRLPRETLPGGGSPGGFRTTDIVPGAWIREPVDPRIHGWSERLKGRADALLANRLTFFNLDQVFLGDPVDWNRDHESGKPAPRRLSQTIDYRDFTVTGDAKMVWEPNRHHHLVVLGRAYRAFGDPRYAEAVLRQIASWIDDNPFGYGMNWRSPLELGIRVINWVWALDLVRDHGDRPERFDERVRETIWRHLREITRKYSRDSSANNHLIGEAAGVFIGSAYFADLPGVRRWKEESHETLSREIIRQTYPDGCTREQALGYHLFVLQFFLVAGIVGKKVGMDFPPRYWERVGRMLEFAAALAEGGPLSLFGDCDDGYVLDLAGGGNDIHELLAVGAQLFERPDLLPAAARSGEEAWWLLGPGAPKRPDAFSPPRESLRLRSKAFPESGLYLLQCGNLGKEDRVSVLFDCAELGYGSIAAHGHADALSFTLRVGGRDVFVDTGTFDYFTYPEWRTYFRTTASHNALEIDGEDQSVMLGPFLWGSRAHSRCTRFDAEGEGGIVVGEHDGYTRLPSPARHSRTIGMDAGSGVLNVTDEIQSNGAHDVRIFFHAAEDCTVGMNGVSTVRIGVGSTVVMLDIDPALTVTLISGSEAPISGWVSRGYHRKSPSTTIIARGRTHGNTRVRFIMRVVRNESGTGI
jgi:hypothetical protein